MDKKIVQNGLKIVEMNIKNSWNKQKKIVEMNKKIVEMDIKIPFHPKKISCSLKFFYI